MKVCIDCFGNRADDPGFLSESGSKTAFLVDKQDSITYMCFRNDSVAQPIHKVSEVNGVTTIAWAFGKWADRANLVYDMELSRPRVVEL